MNIFKKIYNRFFSGKSKLQLELEYLTDRGLELGENVHCFSADCFDPLYPHLISIGKNTTISSNVTILAHDASPNVVRCSTKIGRVRIGENVFIGARTVILCDVVVGDNVIIGAGSVVSKDLPGNAVYAGVPAKRICSIEEYGERYKKLLAERMDFNDILPWYEWADAPADKKQQMKEILEEGFGFV